MPRPRKCRCVRWLPAVERFHPFGQPARGEVILGVEELEALRLADLEGKTHEEAAEAMRVSRQTFGRIIESARAKVAEALVSGKSIIIRGGTYEMEKREFKCVDCGNVWDVPFCEPRPEKCPKCGSTNFHRVGGPRMGRCMGRRGFGQCCQIDE
ncbi:MAG: DUF134 domain-containing protein [Armatimonadota bacterium]|nr:DUF134 domain-containing protein [Armatimonadota bacterium]